VGRWLTRHRSCAYASCRELAGAPIGFDADCRIRGEWAGVDSRSLAGTSVAAETLQCRPVKGNMAYQRSTSSRSSLSHNRRERKNEKGFALVLMTTVLVVSIGMLGLAFDLGQMFITKTELQTFVDASVVAATQQLDGAQAGVQTIADPIWLLVRPGVPLSFDDKII
jgi:Putative Flp pilus-assembly TadE/G-like